ncbi:hypothetical protein [Pyxidicoccus sp. MSG2]|uniref:hypothetical protein n=1 Tax=Pyxidicoccus sp. MSG2 TaxID=2996790 RepID=UPI00226EC07F|nr:hypothetical protein [Pyxidicoccus sp. MSG2]MCY1015725.1 hypothetical protein [Pyxidicoccus sp. MSG2]
MHLRRFSFLVVPAVATWLGCAGGEPGTAPESDEGLPPVVVVDPGQAGDGTWMGVELAAGCDTDAGTPSNTVLVTSSTRFHTAAGVATRPNDMSASPPEVLVPNGLTFTRITGTAVAGGYQFTGVPSGAYYLKTGTSYIVTDERQVELGTNRLGRADTVFTSQYETPLQLNLSGLAPWTPYKSSYLPGSSVAVASGQVEVFGEMEFPGGVAAGQTSLVTNQASLPNYMGNMPVFNASAGDKLYVSQLGQMDAGTLPDGGALAYETVVRGLETSAFNFTPNGTTALPITGVMQPVSMTELPIEWRLPEYTIRASEVHPAATLGTSTFSIVPAAHGLTNGWIGYSGELLNLLLPAGASFNLTRRLTYGNPFPTTWGVVGTTGYSFRVVGTVAGSPTQYTVSGSISTSDRLENLVAGPLLPRVTSPRSLSIDGIAASVQREVGTVSPVISWLPPSMGSPSAYRMTLYRFPTGQTSATTQARFYLPGSATQVRLPAGTLAPASIHYLRVTAVDAPNYDVEREPFGSAERLPYASADALSSLFTTP